MNNTYLEKCDFIGAKGIKALSSKTVTIVGLGGIGTTLAQILVRNGINLRIVDKARVDEKDINRQTLYIADDKGKFKAKQAKKRLEEINGDIKIRMFHEDLVEDNIFLLESDLIIDTSNNMETSLLIDKFTIEKRIHFLFANYTGEKGHVLMMKTKTGPRIKKLQDQLSFETIETKGVFSPITTLIASLLASETIKELVGIETETRLLTIDMLKTEIKHKTVTAKKK